MYLENNQCYNDSLLYLTIRIIILTATIIYLAERRKFSINIVGLRTNQIFTFLICSIQSIFLNKYTFKISSRFKRLLNDFDHQINKRL